MDKHREISKDTLIIYAHPSVAGHNSKTLSEIERKLKEKNIGFETIDLYKIRYNPVLSDDELYSAGNKNISEDTRRYQEKLQHAKHLILIYPIWWGGMPAIMKGFFDRTLTSGFAFKYVNGIPVGLLKGKKAAVVITSGAPTFVSRFLLGNRYQLTIKKDILGFCGIDSKVFQIDMATKIDKKQEEKIVKSTDAAISWLY